MTSAASGKRSAETSIVAAQYEVLRGAALGHVLPPEARSGLALFLRRGMWGWARALATAEAQEQPIRSSCRSTTACEHTAVVHVFAAMAMNINDRRAR